MGRGETRVIKAKDLIPDAYDEEGSESDSDSESGRAEDIVDDLTYDVRNLTACNYSGLLLPTDSDEREEFLVDQTTRAAQLLIKRIFALPTESGEHDILAILPEKEEMVLPRSQRIPDAPVETKWEKYAKDKGIQKKKKERMIYDEKEEKWMPRYGYKRTNTGIDNEPVLEIKKGDDPFADPWEKSREDKKVRVAKNTKQMLKNRERADIIRGKKDKQADRPSSMGDGGMTLTSRKMAGVPINLDSKGGAAKKGKEGVKEALGMAQFSTASMGRYDEYRKDEPAPKLKGKKRAFADNLASTGDEDKKRMKANIRIVEDKVDKKKRGVTNSLKAYAGIIPDAPEDTFKQKKGKGKTRSGDGGIKGKAVKDKGKK
jgi:regulator of ribosome biosynthesis